MKKELGIKKKSFKIMDIIHNSRFDVRRALFLMRKSEGFTLLELLVAISIIAVLLAFLMTNFFAVRQRARDGQRKSDLRQIQAALEMYRADTGGYPVSPLLNCPTATPASFGNAPTCSTTYLQTIPNDPFEGDVLAGGSGTYKYTYLPVMSGTLYTTYSLVACLENVNDSQKDPILNADEDCGTDDTKNVSYTLQNP